MKTPDPASRASRYRATLAPLALALLVALSTGNARAARLDYQLELTGLHSDNLNLSENNQANESVLVPRLRFDLKEEGASVELHARGEIERRHYTGNEFDDETRAEFAGQFNWALFPQRMHLVLEDYLSEEPINFRDGRYPGNLQRVNIFLGGPSFFARLGDTSRLQIDVRGADSQAEVSRGFDSRRYSAAAALQHDINATSNVSLHLAHTRVEFDQPETTIVDYTRQDGYVRYEGRLRDIEYQLDAGRSRLDRENADNESTTLARATVQWQINPQNRLRFRARHQFADEVQDLVVRLSDPDESLVPDLVDSSSSLVTAGVYRQSDVELDYRFTGDRLGFRVRPIYRELRYISRLDADRTENAVIYQASYRLTPLTRIVFDGSYRKRDFRTIDELDRDHVYALGIEQQRTRHWGWRAQVVRNERDSNLPDPVYKENAVLVTLWWKR